MNDVAKSNSRILRFFSNPWIGIASTIATFAGLVLAIYFYFAAISHPDIVYYLNPDRTPIVKQGSAASRLAVQFDAHPLTSDVTAAQIAIWNRGNSAIRREAILSPIIVRTAGASILEAKVIKKSRDVVHVDLDDSRLAKGEIQLSWNVLEQGDGAIIQVIYAGGSDAAIDASGVVEGQSSIREMKFPGKIKSPTEQVRSEREAHFIGYLNLTLAVAMLLASVPRVRKRQPRLQWRSLLDFGLPLILVVGSCYLLYGWWSFSVPPFSVE
jgi:hypothetical protein